MLNESHCDRRPNKNILVDPLVGLAFRSGFKTDASHDIWIAAGSISNRNFKAKNIQNSL